jgi:Zn-dependent protease with chaperone function
MPFSPVRRRVLLGALLVISLPVPAAAGESRAAAAAAVDELQPVAVPAPTARAVQYHHTGNCLWAFRQLWALAVPAALLLTGFSARLRSAAQRVGRVWFLTVGVYAVLYCAVDFVIDLPLAYYAGFVRPHAYGLAASSYTLGRWFGKAIKALLLEMGGSFLFLWIPYLLLARSPKRWWLYTTLLSVPCAFFMALIAPIWIDPLFNDFGPMKDPALERKIAALAERAGIPESRIYEVNKSVDTRALNGYVTGFLATRRIVLYDTLLAEFDDREVLAVMGHEMGHYVLGHVTRSILLSSLLVLAGLFAVDRAGRWLTGRFSGRFGFATIADVASFPLLLLLFQLTFLALDPIVLAYSRYQEHQADRFALELTRTNHSAASAFVKFQEKNLGVPWHTPLEKLWMATHPSVGERIEFCNHYHPWTEGRPLVYGGLFRPQAPAVPRRTGSALPSTTR